MLYFVIYITIYTDVNTLINFYAKIVLVDGSSYLFRAYHALPNLSNSQGEPTGAILGVINMLKKLPDIYNTKYVAVVLIQKVKIFVMRCILNIKLIVKAMDDELRVQIQPLHEIIKNGLSAYHKRWC